MLELFCIVNTIALIMMIWLKSDAIIEWGSLFGLSKFLKIQEFYEMKLNELPTEITYPTFLKIKYNNFITKMLTCPLCLCIWLSNLFCFSYSFLTLDPFFLFLVPPVCIMSLLTYGITMSLIKFSA